MPKLHDGLRLTRFLFLTRFVWALFFLVLALSTLLLLLRPSVIRAFRGGTPQSLCGFMPAFLAKVAALSS